MSSRKEIRVETREITIYTCDLCNKEGGGDIHACSVCGREACRACSTYVHVRGLIPDEQRGKYSYSSDVEGLFCKDDQQKALDVMKRAGFLVNEQFRERHGIVLDGVEIAS